MIDENHDELVLRQNSSLSNPLLERANTLADECYDRNRKRNSFLSMFIQDEESRKEMLRQIDIAATEFEFRKQALILIRKSQMQALNEACNQYVLQGKANLRVEMGKFVVTKAEELRQHIDDKSAKYVKRLELMLEDVENIKNKRIKEKRIEQLEEAFEDFANLQKQLYDKFVHILKEEIKVE